MSSRTAAPAVTPRKTAERDVVYTWRVGQLVRLGLARPVAEAIADKVDWHEVAKLVRRGCPASLAVTIVE